MLCLAKLDAGAHVRSQQQRASHAVQWQLGQIELTIHVVSWASVLMVQALTAASNDRPLGTESDPNEGVKIVLLKLDWAKPQVLRSTQASNLAVKCF